MIEDAFLLASKKMFARIYVKERERNKEKERERGREREGGRERERGRERGK